MLLAYLSPLLSLAKDPTPAGMQMLPKAIAIRLIFPAFIPFFLGAEYGTAVLCPYVLRLQTDRQTPTHSLYKSLLRPMKSSSNDTRWRLAV